MLINVAYSICAFAKAFTKSTTNLFVLFNIFFLFCKIIIFFKWKIKTCFLVVRKLKIKKIVDFRINRTQGISTDAQNVISKKQIFKWQLTQVKVTNDKVSMSKPQLWHIDTLIIRSVNVSKIGSVWHEQFSSDTGKTVKGLYVNCN